MADIILSVEVRERTGTGGAREARREGKGLREAKAFAREEARLASFQFRKS